MTTISRRSVVSSLFSSGLLGVLLPARVKAATDPHMRAALEALRTAHRELREATPDEQGDRKRAKRLARRVIAVVERRIKFDNLQ